MKLKKGTELQLQVTSLNMKGKGIAKHTVLNPHYAPNSPDYYHSQEELTYNIAIDGLYPGDEALVEVYKSKKLYSEAKVLKIIKKSPDRTEPKNNYANISGATPLECLQYSKQLHYKENEVKRILQNILKNPDKTEINPIQGMEDPWLYRNKMQYSFGHTESMEPTLGLHVKRRRYDIVPVSDCHLHEANINQIIQFFQEKAFQSPYNFTPYQHSKNAGDLRNLTTKSNKLHPQKQNMIILEISQNADLQKSKQLMQDFINQYPDTTSVYIDQIHVQKGQTTTSTLHHLHGQTHIQEILQVEDQTLTFNIGPHTFFQPNPSQAQKIYSLAAQEVPDQKEQIIYDLFSGTGTLGLSVAHRAKHIYGIDIEKTSIQSAHQNQKQNDIQNATYIAGDVFKDLPKLDWPKPDTIIIDPPRSGMHEKTVEFISQLNPTKIIYVSCNIKTFAQNLQQFQDLGWSLQKITPVDQFPHTRHLEIVSVISKQ
jgi:23S rRNA (uracil1939-C5)-methyltransferase